jgi:RNA polymerase primary sigma factor
VLRDLARQLRFEPAEAARRQLARAEELAMQLLDESGKAAGEKPDAYPEDWVVFRITGLRTDAGGGTSNDGASGVVVREALLSDLPALIDQLSIAANLGPADLATSSKKSSQWLGAADLCTRWKVSRKTLDRYRRLGLVSRRINLGRGRSRVVYSEPSVQAFERVHRLRVEQAGEFTRIDARTLARIVRRATTYRRRFGWTLHHCAQRIAAREGRSLETVRQALRRHDRKSTTPLFTEPGPLDAEQRAWIERASRRGGNMTSAAKKLRKSRTSVYRAVGGRRATRLRELDLRGPIGPTFTRADAEEVFLNHAAAKTGLGTPGASNVGELMRMAATIQPETAPRESARAAAYWFLLWSASQSLSLLKPTTPGPAASATLDAIETRLLWASRLKAEMVRSELPLLLRTIEAQTARRLESIPGPVLHELIHLGLDALIDAVDRFDPFKGGRAAAPAGIGLTRAISQWLRTSRERLGSPARAAAKVDLDQYSLVDWTRRVHPWQTWLEPPTEVRAKLTTLPDRERGVLEARFGWNNEPPSTVEHLAKTLGTTPTRIAAMQRRSIAQLAFGAAAPRAKRRKPKP